MATRGRRLAKKIVNIGCNFCLYKLTYVVVFIGGQPYQLQSTLRLMSMSLQVFGLKTKYRRD